MKYSKRNKIALFLLAAILFMQSVLFPITTYASKNTAEDAQRAAQEASEAGAEAAAGAVGAAAGEYSDGIFDGNDEVHDYDPTYMRWVGTEERACLLVYLVDYNTGELKDGYEKIIYYTLEDAAENDSRYEWPKYVTETIPTIRVGNSNELSKDARFAYGGWKNGQEKYNMPALVSFSSGEDSLKSWMESSSGKVIDGHEFTNCEWIVYREFGKEAFKKVTPSSTSSNGDPECLAVYEIITANSIFGLGGNREEPVPAYKTVEIAPNKEKTLRAPGKFFGTLIGMTSKAGAYGINFDSDGATANYKWMQSVAKSCGIDNPDGWCKGKIPPKSRMNLSASDNLSTSEMRDSGWGIGVMDPPKIPLGTCNDSTPGNTEEITEYTKGNRKMGKREPKG